MLHIPGYHIVRTLAEGGMAKVYLAVQDNLGREVALKVMSPALTSAHPGYGERFLHEARIVAKLVHPNIVTVHDVGVHDGHYYLAMTYVPGEDLLRQRNQLSLKQNVLMLQQIALALDFAHQKGYVHGDIKPENILIDHDRALLADFGIARLAGDGSIGAAGTPSYMSPEQAAGATLDQRSDLYSLGVVLFWLVSGRLPFPADTETPVNILHATEPVPCLPAEVIPFQGIVDRAMAKRPENRYSSGAELADALTNVVGCINLNMETDWRDLISRTTGPAPDDAIFGDFSGPAFTFHPTPVQAGPAEMDLGQTGPTQTDLIQADPIQTKPRAATPRRWTPEPALTGRFVLRPRDRRFPAPPSRGSFLGRLSAVSVVLLVTAATIAWIWQQLPEGHKGPGSTLYEAVISGGAHDNAAPSVDVEPGRDEPTADNAHLTTASQPGEIQDEGEAAAMADTDLTEAGLVASGLDESGLVETGFANKALADSNVDNNARPRRQPPLDASVAAATRDDAGSTATQDRSVETRVEPKRPEFATKSDEVDTIARHLAESTSAQETNGRAALGEPSAPAEAASTDVADTTNGYVASSRFIAAQLELATTAVQAGRLTEPRDRNAVAHYQQVLRLDPDNTAAQTGLQQVAATLAKRAAEGLDRGDPGRARTLLQQATALNPSGREVRRLEEQLAAVQRKESARPLLTRAQRAHAKGALITPTEDNAFDLYHQVLRRDWSSHLALRGLAEVEVQLADEIERLWRNGKQNEAQSLYRQALQRYPGSADLQDAGRNIGMARQVERNR